MVRKLDIITESERVRTTAEDVFKDNGYFQPMIGVFEGGTYKGAIIVRTAEGEDDKDINQDKKCAFAEACMLITLLRGDEAVVSFDSYVTSTEGDKVTQAEAINVMIASDMGAIALMMPYARDEDGNFSHWVKEEDNEDIDPSIISGNMIATLAHFMVGHPKLEYPELMMRAISKRGHMIILPDGRHFSEGILSEKNIRETFESADNT